MHEYRKRQPTGAILLRFFAMAAGTLVLFMLSVVVARAAWGMYDTFKVAVDARDSAEGQLATLKTSETRLTASVESFETPQGVEHEIRERFGVAKPGEGEIQIVRDQGSTSLEIAPEGNFFIKIFGSLFGW
jgi:cell division protein FtsB